VAPELLKHEIECHHAVDFWAVGCILTFMAFKSSFFYYAAYSLAQEYNISGNSEDDNESCDSIFKETTQILGILATLGCHSPEEQGMWRTEVETLAIVKSAFYADIQREFKDELIEKLGEDGLAFVESCLTLNAHKRLDAVHALQHAYLKI
jgi:serine/threonine protein kinase